VTTPERRVLKGDVDDNGAVNIGDVLEILKYLAGMKNTTIDPFNETSWNAACITGTQPVIADVLEILKFLAGMDSAIEYGTREEMELRFEGAEVD
jgi:hypothetical protein